MLASPGQQSCQPFDSMGVINNDEAGPAWQVVKRCPCDRNPLNEKKSVCFLLHCGGVLKQLGLADAPWSCQVADALRRIGKVSKTLQPLIAAYERPPVMKQARGIH